MMDEKGDKHAWRETLGGKNCCQLSARCITVSECLVSLRRKFRGRLLLRFISGKNHHFSELTGAKTLFAD